MRLLWVKAGGLVPPDTGGKIRSFQTIKELARRHDVTLYTFYKSHPDDVHDELADMFERVIARPLQLPPSRSIADLLLFARYLATGTPYTTGKYCRPAVKREVHELVRGGGFDLIVCDFLHPADVLPWSGSPPIVLFTHNVEAEVWERQTQLTTNPILRFALQFEARALARAERKYAELADHVIAVSERNADHFRAFLDPQDVSVVPTGVDVDYFTPTADRSDDSGCNMVFTGSMDWMPNDDCVRYFVAEILPLIWKEHPEARFWAVGKNPTESLRRLDDGERVFVTGTVDDIRPYLARADVFVLPMRSGSGTRLKLYESMAAGNAIVSTTIGAEGLAVTSGENLVLADGAEEFAAAVVSLLGDDGRRQSLGVAARTLVEDRYSWSAAVVDFEAVLERTLEAAG